MVPPMRTYAMQGGALGAWVEIRAAVRAMGALTKRDGLCAHARSPQAGIGLPPPPHNTHPAPTGWPVSW
jgi:hypothetical protein